MHSMRKMNVKAGGKQPSMQNNLAWEGILVVPKGLQQVPKDRGINTRGMKLEDMRKELASHDYFITLTTMVTAVCCYRRN